MDVKLVLLVVDRICSSFKLHNFCVIFSEASILFCYEIYEICIAC